MSTETDRLEREAEEHRSNLEATFETIRGSFSVGRIAEEFSDYLKDGQGADTVKTLGRQVRDNPLALGLVGAGFAWLFLGQGTRAATGEWAERARHAREERRYDRFAQAFPAGGEGADRPLPPTARAGSSAMAEPSGRGPGVGERISGTAGRTGEAGGRAAAGVSDATGRVGRSVGAATGSARDTAQRGMDDLADSASRASASVRSGARRAGDTAYRTGGRARRGLADLIHDEPLACGAAVLAFGAAIGAMLPATRQEDAWMGEPRDRVRDEALVKGRDAVDRAETAASDTYEAARGETEPDPSQTQDGRSRPREAETGPSNPRMAADENRSSASEADARAG